MGLVAAQYIVGCYKKTTKGHWEPRTAHLQQMEECFERGSMDGCTADFCQWWEKLTLLIRFCHGVKDDSQDCNLLYAALNNRDTPPRVVELIIRLYPELVHDTETWQKVMPLHVAARTALYVPRSYEEDWEPDQTRVLELLQEMQPESKRRREAEQGRNAIHLALEARKTWTYVKPLVSGNRRCLKLRDPVTKLFPFQMAALRRLGHEDTYERLLLKTRNQSGSEKWQKWSMRQRERAIAKVVKQDELECVRTVYEMLRRYPSAVKTAIDKVKAVKKSLDRTGMGMVGAHYTLWCYEQEGIDMKLNAAKAAMLKKATQEASLGGVLGEVSEEFTVWWQKMKFWIWYCFEGEIGTMPKPGKLVMPREDNFILHAAVSNSDTPPQIIQLLLGLYPASASTALPQTNVLPIHVASRTLAYTKRFYEDESSLKTLEMLVHANPRARKQTSNGQLPLHLAIESGRTWEEIRCLVQGDHSILRRLDPKTGLYPFQQAAVLRSIKPEQQRRFQHIARNSMDEATWKRSSRRERNQVARDVQLNHRLQLLSTIYELLRRDPSAIDAARRHATAFAKRGNRLFQENEDYLGLSNINEEDEDDDDDDEFGPALTITDFLSQLEEGGGESRDRFRSDASVFSQMDVMSVISASSEVSDAHSFASMPANMDKKRRAKRKKRSRKGKSNRVKGLVAEADEQPDKKAREAKTVKQNEPQDKPLGEGGQELSRKAEEDTVEDADVEQRRASNEAMVPIIRTASSEEQPFDVAVERITTDAVHDTQSSNRSVSLREDEPWDVQQQDKEATAAIEEQRPEILGLGSIVEEEEPWDAANEQPRGQQDNTVNFGEGLDADASEDGGSLLLESEAKGEKRTDGIVHADGVVQAADCADFAKEGSREATKESLIDSTDLSNPVAISRAGEESTDEEHPAGSSGMDEGADGLKAGAGGAAATLSLLEEEDGGQSEEEGDIGGRCVVDDDEEYEAIDSDSEARRIASLSMSTSEDLDLTISESTGLVFTESADFNPSTSSNQFEHDESFSFDTEKELVLEGEENADVWTYIERMGDAQGLGGSDYPETPIVSSETEENMLASKEPATNLDTAQLDNPDNQDCTTQQEHLGKKPTLEGGSVLDDEAAAVDVGTIATTDDPSNENEMALQSGGKLKSPPPCEDEVAAKPEGLTSGGRRIGSRGREVIIDADEQEGIDKPIKLRPTLRVDTTASTLDEPLKHQLQKLPEDDAAPQAKDEDRHSAPSIYKKGLAKVESMSTAASDNGGLTVEATRAKLRKSPPSKAEPVLVKAASLDEDATFEDKQKLFEGDSVTQFQVSATSHLEYLARNQNGGVTMNRKLRKVGEPTVYRSGWTSTPTSSEQKRRRNKLVHYTNSIEEKYLSCMKCAKGKRDTMLLPCSHLCLCSRCSVKGDISTCPMCGQEVKDRKVIFL